MFDGFYVPRILLCGDLNSFRHAAADMQVDIVGQISFTGAAERGENFLFATVQDLEAYVPKDFRIFLDGKEISADTLRNILDGAADYIVFDDGGEIIGRRNELHALKLSGRLLTRETLFRQARRNFFAHENFPTLARFLRDNQISHVLDLDALFAETGLFMFPEMFPRTDAVCKSPAPIHENFYGKIYSALDACRFKVFDALLLAERDPVDFVDTLLAVDALSAQIVTFARKNSALESWLATYAEAFEKISAVPATNGRWYLLTKRVPKDFRVWVVTHKDARLATLPDGYEIIHAGHSLAKENFGYRGDSTGDNISALNFYLNEITALYWLWKNTNHAIVGLNHYRRFFTTAADESFAVEKILSRNKAQEILRDFDIIVAENVSTKLTVSCWQMLLSGPELEQFVERIFREHIARRQPDYLDAFDAVSQSFSAFQYEIFITRRPILDAYCSWLFSFLLDVTQEIFARTNIRQINNPRKYRIISFVAERLLTVWLWKNPLKIKRLPVLFREDV